MDIKKNISLQSFNTFGMNVNAREFVSVNSLKDLTDVLNTNPPHLFILGGGSNMLLTKDFEGLTLVIATKGISIINENSVAPN